MNTRRNVYQKPMLTVIELCHRATLLAGSEGVDSIRQGYGQEIPLTWGE